MPIYCYCCDNGHEFDRLLALEDYKEPQTCECGADSQKIIKPTMLNCDIPNWESYVSPASGKLITSHKDRRADMQSTGCVDYDAGVRVDAKKAQDKAERDLDRQVDATVEKAFDAMPIRKKEKLENELKHSELEYTRTGDT